MSDGVDLEGVEWETLGQAIRERRQARALTLVELAGEVGLSQPFLSQIENGRARPSMRSLYRIAHALGTTPQAFFGGPASTTSAPTLVRAGAARAVEVNVVDDEGAADRSSCRLLLAGDAPFHVLEFVGLPTEFLEYWEHDGFEAVYVIDGVLEIDVAGDRTILRAGDVLSYPAHLPHRLRAPEGGTPRVLLIETKVAALQDRGPANHAPIRARGRGRSGARRRG